MKYRPIIFKGWGVRGILDGSKTMTRRILRPQPGPMLLGVAGWYGTGSANAKHYASAEHWRKGVLEDFGPYRVGDRLWVRETWAHYQPVLNVKRPDGRAYTEVGDGCAAYRADGHDSIGGLRQHLAIMHGAACEGIEINGDRWRPSIHMPRWASRLTLEITEVLPPQRVQEINNDDAIVEGVPNPWYRSWEETRGYPGHGVSAINSFSREWDKINKKRGHGWDVNPWVWPFRFKRVT